MPVSVEGYVALLREIVTVDAIEGVKVPGKTFFQTPEDATQAEVTFFQTPPEATKRLVTFFQVELLEATNMSINTKPREQELLFHYHTEKSLHQK